MAVPLLSLRASVRLPWSRFSKPLYDPGRSDFPSPVLASALHAIYQKQACPTGTEVQETDSHTPLASVVCLLPRRRIKGPAGVSPLRAKLGRIVSPAMSWSCPDPLATECPGLLRPRRVLPEGGTTSRVASEGVTPPSQLLRAHAPDQIPPHPSVSALKAGSLQVAVSPCWEMALPDIISATLA